MNTIVLLLTAQKAKVTITMHIKYVIMFIARTIKYIATQPKYAWWNVNESRISQLQYSLLRILISIHACSYLFLGATIVTLLIAFPVSSVRDRFSLFCISLIFGFASYGVSGICAPRSERNLLPRKYALSNRILSDTATFRFSVFLIASAILSCICKAVEIVFFR